MKFHHFLPSLAEVVFYLSLKNISGCLWKHLLLPRLGKILPTLMLKATTSAKDIRLQQMDFITACCGRMVQVSSDTGWYRYRSLHCTGWTQQNRHKVI